MMMRAIEMFVVIAASETTGGNTTETEDQQTQEQKFVEEWAKLFFSMARVPRKGQQMLIFPGLYGNLILFLIL